MSYIQHEYVHVSNAGFFPSLYTVHINYRFPESGEARKWLGLVKGTMNSKYRSETAEDQKILGEINS